MHKLLANYIVDEQIFQRLPYQTTSKGMLIAMMVSTLLIYIKKEPSLGVEITNLNKFIILLQLAS